MTIALLAIFVVVAGCASTSRTESISTKRTPARGEPWKFLNIDGVKLRTPHYLIHTTIADADFNERLADVMEGAHAHYRALAPTIPNDPQPMESFVFANRKEWAMFTAQRTGDDAAIYLQINRGGYTVRDFFVAYYIGDSGTFAVASHEGFHQFVSRHFKGRLPPFLEEGLATTFENISWSAGGRPRWDTVRNVTRSGRLKSAIEAKALWPLAELVKLHAGDVVAQPSEKIEAFYAQNWAFARFLLDGDGGRYRPALQKMISDAAAGQLYEPTRRPDRAVDSFDPAAVVPMLEHYLSMKIDAIDAAYQRYLKKIAADAVGAVPS